MKLIFMDTEANQPSNKTIQIGAVSAELSSVKAEIVSEFDIFVNPQEPLNPEISELTGIYEEHVRDAPTIKDAWAEFDKWVQAQNARYLLAWGNDFDHLYREAGEPTPKNAINIKPFFTMINANRTNKNQPGGLAANIRALGLGFQGKQHNALDDAKNTWLLFAELVRRHKAYSEIKDFMEETL